MKITQYVKHLFFAASVVVAPATWANTSVVPAMPELAAKSYVLMDAVTGQVIVEHNADEALPPASLTKLMTSYIATQEIKEGKLAESDLVTVSEKAWRTGGSRMFIQVGTQVSVEDLLRGIIIQSGNDASVALAEHLAGTEEAFAEVMNRTAKTLGLTNTHFKNATGLPAPDHYSSAMDMAKLSRAIIYDDPDHYALYAEKEFTWNGIKQPNRNLLLWRDSTVDGLKTGHTDEAGYCLVASAVRDEMRLIASVFGTTSEASRAAETQKLLTYGFRFYEGKTFYRKGTSMADARVWKGQTDQLKVGTATDLAVTLPRGQAEKVVLNMNLQPQLVAPIAAGDVVGTVDVMLEDKVLKTENVIALEAIEEAGFFGRLWDSIRLFFAGLFN